MKIEAGLKEGAILQHAEENIILGQLRKNLEFAAIQIPLQQLSDSHCVFARQVSPKGLKVST